VTTNSNSADEAIDTRASTVPDPERRCPCDRISSATVPMTSSAANALRNSVVVDRSWSARWDMSVACSDVYQKSNQKGVRGQTLLVDGVGEA
jgi:hypothetical protein